VFVEVGVDLPEISQRSSGDKKESKTQVSAPSDRSQNRKRRRATFGKRPIEIDRHGLEVGRSCAKVVITLASLR
jgi:hypothetical protein